jgi:SPP1 family predicted phage head-tail adaptor
MSKYPTIGELRHRIFFQQPVTGDDGYGGKPVTWVNCGEAWARIEPLTGREFFYAHQIQAEVTHRVTIRFRQDIKEDMRISTCGRVLEIESIVDLNEAHQFLEFFCRESK